MKLIVIAKILSIELSIRNVLSICNHREIFGWPMIKFQVVPSTNTSSTKIYKHREHHQVIELTTVSGIFQLLCHVLNRVTTRSGVFCSVISHSIQGLEMVLHYPIMAVTVGILNQLVMKAPEKRSGRESTQACNNQLKFWLYSYFRIF